MYPRVRAYLDSLPAGIHSYPDVQAKAAIVGHYLSGTLLSLDQLPPELHGLLSKPPAPSAWVSTVHLTALTIAVADHRKLTDEATIQWAYETNLAMFNNPMFKLLLFVASPAMLVKGAGSRLESLHRGMSLVSLPKAEREWLMTMTFRPYVLTPLMVRCYVTGFRAAMELGRVREPKLELTECGVDHAFIRVTWAK